MRRLSSLDQDFQAILQWLAAEREEEVRTMCSHRDSWTVAQSQGHVQCLDSFLDQVQASRK